MSDDEREREEVERVSAAWAAWLARSALSDARAKGGEGACPSVDEEVAILDRFIGAAEESGLDVDDARGALCELAGIARREAPPPSRVSGAGEAGAPVIVNPVLGHNGPGRLDVQLVYVGTDDHHVLLAEGERLVVMSERDVDRCGKGGVVERARDGDRGGKGGVVERALDGAGKGGK